MAEHIEFIVNGNANFAPIYKQLEILLTTLKAANIEASKLGANASMISGLRNAESQFKTTVRSIEGFRVQTVQAADSVQVLTDKMVKGHHSLGQYFGAWRQSTKGIVPELQAIAEANIRMRNSMVIPSAVTRGQATVVTNLHEMVGRTEIMAEYQKVLNTHLMHGATKLIDFGKNTQWAGRQLMVGFTVPLLAAGGALAAMFYTVDQGMKKLLSVYGLGGTSGGKFSNIAPTPAELDAIKTGIMDVAKSMAQLYGQNAATTVAVASDLAAAGYTQKELLSLTETATKAMVLGQTDQQAAIKATIALQNTYRLSLNGTADALAFFSAAQAATSTTMNDLIDAVPRVGPIVANLGGTYKDVVAMLVAMKEGGVAAGEGANALKTGLTRIIQPTKAASEDMKALGINLKAISELQSPVLMIQALQQALSKLSPTARTAAITEIFGRYQVSRITALLDNFNRSGTQSAKVVEMMGLTSSQLQDIQNRQTQQFQKSTSQQFLSAIESLKTSLLSIGEEFLKVITPIVNGLTTVIDLFNKIGPMKYVIMGAFAGTAIIGPIIMMVGLFSNMAGQLFKITRLIKMFGQGMREAGSSSPFALMRAGIKGLGNYFEQVDLAQKVSIELSESLGTSLEKQELALARYTKALAEYSNQVNRLISISTGRTGGGAGPMPGGGAGGVGPAGSPFVPTIGPTGAAAIVGEASRPMEVKSLKAEISTAERGGISINGVKNVEFSHLRPDVQTRFGSNVLNTPGYNPAVNAMGSLAVVPGYLTTELGRTLNNKLGQTGVPVIPTAMNTDVLAREIATQMGFKPHEITTELVEQLRRDFSLEAVAASEVGKLSQLQALSMMSPAQVKAFKGLPPGTSAAEIDAFLAREIGPHWEQIKRQVSQGVIQLYSAAQEETAAAIRSGRVSVGSITEQLSLTGSRFSELLSEKYLAIIATLDEEVVKSITSTSESSKAINEAMKRKGAAAVINVGATAEAMTAPVVAAFEELIVTLKTSMQNISTQLAAASEQVAVQSRSIATEINMIEAFSGVSKGLGVRQYGSIPKFLMKAGGGKITGPGGPKDDVIPALLSNGEYVVNAAATNHYGAGFLDAVNNKKLAGGGFIKLADGGWISKFLEGWVFGAGTHGSNVQPEKLAKAFEKSSFSRSDIQLLGQMFGLKERNAELTLDRLIRELAVQRGHETAYYRDKDLRKSVYVSGNQSIVPYELNQLLSKYYKDWEKNPKKYPSELTRMMRDHGQPNSEKEARDLLNYLNKHYSGRSGGNYVEASRIFLERMLTGENSFQYKIELLRSLSDFSTRSLYSGPLEKLWKFKASGGHISGPGGPRDDVIPAMLSNGEYVVNADAVNHYGVGFMNGINTKKLALGGIARFAGGSSGPLAANEWKYGEKYIGKNPLFHGTAYPFKPGDVLKTGSATDLWKLADSYAQGRSSLLLKQQVESGYAPRVFMVEPIGANGARIALKRNGLPKLGGNEFIAPEGFRIVKEINQKEFEEISRINALTKVNLIKRAGGGIARFSEGSTDSLRESTLGPVTNSKFKQNGAIISFKSFYKYLSDLTKAVKRKLATDFNDYKWTTIRWDRGSSIGAIGPRRGIFRRRTGAALTLSGPRYARAAEGPSTSIGEPIRDKNGKIIGIQNELFDIYGSDTRPVIGNMAASAESSYLIPALSGLAAQESLNRWGMLPTHGGSLSRDSEKIVKYLIKRGLIERNPFGYQKNTIANNRITKRGFINDTLRGHSEIIKDLVEVDGYRGGIIIEELNPKTGSMIYRNAIRNYLGRNSFESKANPMQMSLDFPTAEKSIIPKSIIPKSIIERPFVLASGGKIYGPGGPKDDVIPAMVSNGEYVINADAVKHYGVGFIDAINTKRLAAGGMAKFAFGGPPPSGPPIIATPGVASGYGVPVAMAREAAARNQNIQSLQKHSQVVKDSGAVWRKTNEMQKSLKALGVGAKGLLERAGGAMGGMGLLFGSQMAGMAANVQGSNIEQAAGGATAGSQALQYAGTGLQAGVLAGMMFGPPGLAAGALIGGLGGAVVGAFMGKKVEDERKLQEAMAKSTEKALALAKSFTISSEAIGVLGIKVNDLANIKIGTGFQKISENTETINQLAEAYANTADPVMKNLMDNIKYGSDTETMQLIHRQFLATLEVSGSTEKASIDAAALAKATGKLGPSFQTVINEWVKDVHTGGQSLSDSMKAMINLVNQNSYKGIDMTWGEIKPRSGGSFETPAQADAAGRNWDPFGAPGSGAGGTTSRPNLTPSNPESSGPQSAQDATGTFMEAEQKAQMLLDETGQSVLAFAEKWGLLNAGFPETVKFVDLLREGNDKLGFSIEDLTNTTKTGADLLNNSNENVKAIAIAAGVKVSDSTQVAINKFKQYDEGLKEQGKKLGDNATKINDFQNALRGLDQFIGPLRNALLSTANTIPQFLQGLGGITTTGPLAAKSLFDLSSAGKYIITKLVEGFHDPALNKIWAQLKEDGHANVQGFLLVLQMLAQGIQLTGGQINTIVNSSENNLKRWANVGQNILKLQTLGIQQENDFLAAAANNFETQFQKERNRLNAESQAQSDASWTLSEDQRNAQLKYKADTEPLQDRQKAQQDFITTQNKVIEKINKEKEARQKLYDQKQKQRDMDKQLADLAIDVARARDSGDLLELAKAQNAYNSELNNQREIKKKDKADQKDDTKIESAQKKITAAEAEIERLQKQLDKIQKEYDKKQVGFEKRSHDISVAQYDIDKRSRANDAAEAEWNKTHASASTEAEDRANRVRTAYEALYTAMSSGQVSWPKFVKDHAKEIGILATDTNQDLGKVRGDLKKTFDEAQKLVGPGGRGRRIPVNQTPFTDWQRTGGSSGWRLGPSAPTNFEKWQSSGGSGGWSWGSQNSSDRRQRRPSPSARSRTHADIFPTTADAEKDGQKVGSRYWDAMTKSWFSKRFNMRNVVDRSVNEPMYQALKPLPVNVQTQIEQLQNEGGISVDANGVITVTNPQSASATINAALEAGFLDPVDNTDPTKATKFRVKTDSSSATIKATKDASVDTVNTFLNSVASDRTSNISTTTDENANATRLGYTGKSSSDAFLNYVSRNRALSVTPSTNPDTVEAALNYAARGRGAPITPYIPRGTKPLVIPVNGLFNKLVWKEGNNWYTTKKDGTTIKIPNPNSFASGGKVIGPGTSTSDSIAAKVSNGEFIIRASSVSKYGTQLLSQINNGTWTPQVSGPMGRVSYSNNIASNSATSGNVEYNINVSVAGSNSSPDEIANAVLRTLQQRERANMTRRAVV